MKILDENLIEDDNTTKSIENTNTTLDLLQPPIVVLDKVAQDFVTEVNFVDFIFMSIIILAFLSMVAIVCRWDKNYVKSWQRKKV